MDVVIVIFRNSRKLAEDIQGIYDEISRVVSIQQGIFLNHVKAVVIHKLSSELFVFFVIEN